VERPDRRVKTELRGDVCVFRCGGVAGERLAEDLPAEVGRCLDSGISAAVVDLDPWAPLDHSGLTALRGAARRQLRAARRRIAAFAEVAGLDGAGLFELNVAVAEALANAVVHGSPHGADDDVHVRFFCYEDEVAVEVVDGGDGLEATPICAPPAAATSGRGIHFMRALTDAVHYTCGPLGTRVLLVKQRS